MRERTEGAWRDEERKKEGTCDIISKKLLKMTRD